MPNLVIHLRRTLKCEWCVIRCGFSSGYHKHICLKKIGLHAQIFLSILGPNQHNNRWARGTHMVINDMINEPPQCTQWAQSLLHH